jgi:hypothetical protein
MPLVTMHYLHSIVVVSAVILTPTHSHSYTVRTCLEWAGVWTTLPNPTPTPTQPPLHASFGHTAQCARKNRKNLVVSSELFFVCRTFLAGDFNHVLHLGATIGSDSDLPMASSTEPSTAPSVDASATTIRFTTRKAFWDHVRHTSQDTISFQGKSLH